MRVAFDLDDTLIPAGRSFATEEPASRVLGMLVSERLRVGAGRLLRDLAAEGHQVWIYTTSFRPIWRVWLLFRAYGVRLTGVVNQAVHDRWVGSNGQDGPMPSKYPPAFGIDLLVDDSSGVAIEGQKYGFSVIVVAPSQEGWVNAVKNGLSRE